MCNSFFKVVYKIRKDMFQPFLYLLLFSDQIVEKKKLFSFLFFSPPFSGFTISWILEVHPSQRKRLLTDSKNCQQHFRNGLSRLNFKLQICRMSGGGETAVFGGEGVEMSRCRV